MNFRRFLHRLSVLAILVVLCGCASLPGGRGKAVDLTVLHTNDHHGRFWKNSDGEYGLAARKTVIDAIRAEVEGRGGSVLLLDAGDINTGVPESDMLDAEPDIRGMNLAGYNAMAVGNHEFDNPLAALRKQEQWMNFPLLSANIYNASGQRLFQPYHIFTFNGLKVAVFGLTTESTATVGNPEHIRGLVFRPAVDEARDLATRLRREADIVIALTHLGFADGQNSGSVALARSVPDIDLIVDGHSHTALSHPVLENGVIIVQAGEYGKYLGRVDLKQEGSEVSLVSGELVAVNLTEKTREQDQTESASAVPQVEENPAMLHLLAPFQDKGGHALMTVIGHSGGNFTGDRTRTRSGETELGNLLCQALMEKTGADVAVMNGGGIRAGLPKGEITYKDVLTVKPFGNTICTVVMTGDQLHGYLNAALAMPAGSGGFAHFGGVEMTVRNATASDIRVQGRNLENTREYVVVLESYLANGGDGYPPVNNRESFVDTGFVDADVLREYIIKHSPLNLTSYQTKNAVRRE